MFSKAPEPNELKNLRATKLGEAKYESNLYAEKNNYVSEDESVSCYCKKSDLENCKKLGVELPCFEMAGAREKLFHQPSESVCGIVTCGGLCPGLNDVIRSITLTALWQYKVKKVLGFRFGYAGLAIESEYPPVELTADAVNDIHNKGGTILGSSRGPQEPAEMVRTLQKYNVNMLFVIGGDGTLSGGHVLAEEILRQNLNISVIGIPKTIDNDIYCSETTFGFSTAVEEARKAIYSAHTEAKAAINGVGLVKLMGRDSGFIAAGATLANSDVNFCLVPEVSFALDGKGGFLEMLEERLDRKKHAVIVVAEGAGQYLFDDEAKLMDNSGNILHKDIGLYLKAKIKEYFSKKEKPVSIKYIDPSYTIRSCAANAHDSAFCLLLGQNSVHAAMSGKTDMFVGFWNHSFTNVPMKQTFKKRKKLSVNDEVLKTIIKTTERVVGFSR